MPTEQHVNKGLELLFISRSAGRDVGRGQCAPTTSLSTSLLRGRLSLFDNLYFIRTSAEG